MKKFLTTILLALILLQPTFVAAQNQPFQPSSQSQTNGGVFNSTNIGNVVSTVIGCTDLGSKIVKKIGDLALKSSSKLIKGAAKAVANFFGFGSAADELSPQPVIDQAVKDLAKDIREKQEKLRMKEYCYDRAAYTVAQGVLGQLSNKTLNWVNTGFGGNPFYVRNIDSFLGSVKNEQVRDYLRVAGNIQAKDGDAVGYSVSSKILEIITGRPSATRAPSTASELKYDAFTKDFSSGGWDAWYRMTQLGENPIAGILSTSQQLGKNIAERQEKTEQELAQGNGFLNQKICVEYAQVPGPDDSPDLYLNPDGSRKCLREETVTPGSVIAKQVEQITGSAVRQLEAADEINEVLSSFFGKLINNLFNKGLQSLGQASNQSFGSFGANDFSGSVGGNNIVIGSNGQPINGTGSGVTPVDIGSGYDTSDFNISNPKHIAAVIKTQKNFRNQTLDSQAAIRKIIPNLGHLDYCLPGPNLSWGDGVNANSSVLSSLFAGRTFAVGATASVVTTNPYTLSSNIGNTTKNFPGRTFNITNTNILSPFVSIGQKFYEWLTPFEETINNNFSLEPLSLAFENLEQTNNAKAFARGFVKESLIETATLPEYVEAISENDTIYIDNIAEVESNISELESIRAEVLDIITTARTRHIADKRALGITVNMSCLNEAYDISNTPISGSPRVESEPTALLNAMEAAQNSFYNNL